MKSIVVQYRCTSPEAAEENQRFVEDVFAELDAMGATGFSYSTFRLDDGLSFVHIVIEEADGGADLSSIPAFQRFTKDIDTRIDAPPVSRGARIVGAHRLRPGVA